MIAFQGQIMQLLGGFRELEGVKRRDSVARSGYGFSSSRQDSGAEALQPNTQSTRK